MNDIAIISYLEVDHNVGLGHAVRLRTILDSLRWAYDHIIIGKGDWIRTVFPSGVICEFQSDLIKLIKKTTEEHRFTLVITDHPNVPVIMWEIEDKTLLKVAIDDVGSSRIRSDVVVNCSACTRYHVYPNLPEWAISLFGLRYLPLRSEFGNISAVTSHRRNGQSLGFVAGSSFAAEEWVYFILSLDFERDGWRGARLIVSPTLRNFDKVKKIGKEKGIEVKTDLTVREMVDFYSTLKVCVMTAGMALYEAFAAGVAVIAYPIQSDMIPETEYFEKRQMLINLGRDGNNSCVLTKVVDGLLKNDEKREMLRERLHGAVDGKGAERIGKILTEVVQDCLRGESKVAAVKRWQRCQRACTIS